MKIALISNNFFQYDAIGKYISLIIKALPQARFDLYLETNTDLNRLPPKTKIKPYFFIKRCPLLGWYLFEWKIGRRIRIIEKIFVHPCRKIIFSFLARSLLKKKYDIIWMQWGLYFNGLYLMQTLSKMKKHPFLIFDYHGTTPPELIKSRGKKMIAQKTILELKKAGQSADLCLVRSKFIKKELEKYGHAQKIKILHLPVFLKKNQKAISLNDKKTIYLLYVGRIAPHKNLAAVIKALQYLKKYKIIFQIIGNFSRPSLKKEKERLEKLARRLKLSNQIQFKGTLASSSLKKYYQKADLFIMPSLHEGFSWPSVEALNYGKAIVYAQTNALPEIIGSAGLNFNPWDPQDLAKKIKIILENPLLKNQLEKKALQRAQKFSWKKFKKNLQSILKARLSHASSALSKDRDKLG